MDHAGFDVTWQPPDEFAATMASVDKQLGKLLTSDAMQSMQQSRFGPMFFPAVLAILGCRVFPGACGLRATEADFRDEAALAS